MIKVIFEKYATYGFIAETKFMKTQHAQPSVVPPSQQGKKQITKTLFCVVVYAVYALNKIFIDSLIALILRSMRE